MLYSHNYNLDKSWLRSKRKRCFLVRELYAENFLRQVFSKFFLQYCTEAAETTCFETILEDIYKVEFYTHLKNSVHVIDNATHVTVRLTS